MRRIPLLLLLMLLIAPAVQAQDSSAPYLYYFDSFVQAVIVERADGTDSRLLGAETIPDTSYVTGPGWSPSGRWLAGTSRQGNPYGNDLAYAPWAISADGKRQVTVLDDYTTAALWWSPTEDFLFAIGLIDDPAYQDTYNIGFRLVDAEQDEILASSEIQTQADFGFYNMPDLWSSSDVRWTADGRYVIAKGTPGYAETASYFVYDAAAHTVSEQSGPGGWGRW